MTTMPEKSKWSRKWPTEEGFYWVYGDVFGVGTDRETGKPYRRLEMGQCRRISNGFMHIVGGNFAFKQEAGDLVLWMKMEEPEVPVE